MTKHDKLTLLLDEFGSTIRESAGERTGIARPKLIAVSTKVDKPKLAATQGEYEEIPLKQVVAQKQYRTHFDDQSLRELADSILALGMIEPIVVRWNRLADVFDLVAGERRYRAAKLANLKHIPARIMELSDAEVAEVQLAENLAREDLNPIDLARAFQDVMQRTGRTAKYLAHRVGVNQTTVTRTLRLLTLPEDVQEKISQGNLAPGIAREVARVKDEHTQRAVLAQAEADELTAAQVAQLVQHVVGTRASTPRRANSKTKRHAKRLTFESAEAIVLVLPKPGANYHDVSEALKLAADEVELRINNNVTL